MPFTPPMHRPRFQPQRCPDHLRRGSASARGYTYTWRKFRENYLRAHPFCAFHTDPRARGSCLVAASQVDHVRPMNDGGAQYDESNLRPLCHSCHSRCTVNYRDNGVNDLPAVQLATGGWV